MCHGNDLQKATRTSRQMDIQIGRHIRSTRPHWGPLDPIVGINALRRWTPNLEINTNTIITKGPCKTGQMDRRTYYTATQGIRPRGLRLHALRAITCHANFRQRATWTTGQRDIDTERQRHRNISSNGTHWGTPEPIVGINALRG